MLLENFVIRNVIFARQAIFSTLYTEKSSDELDHFDLGGYCIACHVKKIQRYDVCLLTKNFKTFNLGRARLGIRKSIRPVKIE